MKKVFRLILSLVIAFAVYSGVITQIWSVPIGIIALCFLAFLATFSTQKKSKTGRKGDATSAILGSSIYSSSSSSSDCGGGGADGGC